MHKVSALNTKSQHQSTFGNTAMQVGQAAAGYVSTDGQAAAKEDDAVGAKHAAAAEGENALTDEAKAMQAAMADLAAKIIALLKELHDAKAALMQNLTRV
jgi:hypothetical protein